MVEQIKKGYYLIKKVRTVGYYYPQSQEIEEGYEYIGETIEDVLTMYNNKIEKDIKTDWSHTVLSEIKWSPLMWCEYLNNKYIKINDGCVSEGVININYQSLEFKWINNIESKFINEFITRYSSYKEKKKEVHVYNKIIETYCEDNNIKTTEVEVVYDYDVLWNRKFTLKIPKENCLSISHNPERKLISSNFKIII